MKDSTKEQIRKLKEAAARSGISHDPDFARRRASEGKAVDTLSDVVEGTRKNIAARPVLEKAEAIARQQALVPKPVGKISQYADDVYKAASKLGGIASKLPFKKLMAVLGPVGAAIGTASDAMASDDLGAGEDDEVMKMREQAMMPKDPKIEEMKAKMAAMSIKPLSIEDRLPNKIPPEIAALGEQESPDYESGLDPIKEISRRKKLLGY